MTTDILTMTTVFINQGALKGDKCYTDKGNEYIEFSCIPYAKPPVGNLRFKSPQLPEPWSGVRDATAPNQSQIACQMDILKGHFIGNEDCLYLNVYTPKLPCNDKQSELLPVMFYIHGGGFIHGNGVIKFETGPDYLIDNNVVVVTINYRLGIFGFLSLNIPEAAGNMGLKDQVQALIWVQNNISKFGGDKTNVTIFGVSAGAASVEYLMLSPKCEGLFHKAILQSGSSLNHWAINLDSQKILDRLLQQIEFQGSIENHREVYEYLITCPPTLLVEESFKIIKEVDSERINFWFVPTIEKDFRNNEAFLTTNPYKLIKEGKFNKVPVIKGFCEMEGYLMDLMKPSIVQELNINKNFTKHFAFSVETSDSQKFNDRVSKAYNKPIKNVNEDDNKRNIIDFFSDYDFIYGIWLSGLIMSNQGVDVYLYKFSYDGKLNFFKNTFDFHKKGAAHADDVTYIFKTIISNFADESDIEVRDKVTKLWTNFAKTGNPCESVVNANFPAWPLFKQSTPTYLKIDKKFTIEIYEDMNKMDIFKEIYDKY